jgi:2-amino-4-hydroxy-6-hydroxymethyldihydropteridine diphosphokinase
MKAVIALGANLGEPEKALPAALIELACFISDLRSSTFIITTPVGGPAQPDYLNAVAIGDCELDPLLLLRKLQEVENLFGRTREIRWGARTLDLDLISYGQLQLDSPDLTLPHPRAHEREFVINPWLEIDPEGELPGIGPIAKLAKFAKIWPSI